MWRAWPIFSTFIGGLGAFVAGSNTVSNMMFSLFQFGVGERIGVRFSLNGSYAKGVRCTKCRKIVLHY